MEEKGIEKSSVARPAGRHTVIFQMDGYPWILMMSRNTKPNAKLLLVTGTLSHYEMALLMAQAMDSKNTSSITEHALLAGSFSWRMMEDQKSTSTSIVQLMVN